MSDNEYTATMDELIDGYRAMRVQELAPVGPAFKRLLVSVEAVVEAHRALAAHDAVRDQRIAELTASLRAAKAYARKGWEHHDKQWRRAEAAEAKIAAVLAAWHDNDPGPVNVRDHAVWLALTATGQESPYLDSLAIDEDDDEQPLDSGRRLSELRDYPGMNGIAATGQEQSDA